jgi:low affinity Fe/Cu permease
MRHATNGLGPFARFARGTSHLAGRPVAFGTMLVVVLAWAVSGPLFGFSQVWQLTINTFTTIVTFLMVFLIQATQNRDSEAIQLKLDELILALDGARDEVIDSENLTEEEQLRLHRKYLAIAERARKRVKGAVTQIEERRERRGARRG